GHAFGRPVAIANLQRGVASFQIAEIAQAGSKPRNVPRRRCGGEGGENADERADQLLLGPRLKRPSGYTAAEQRDELASFHSITSSVRASNEIGGSRPSALAVLRLITSSNLVAYCTGSSPGFSPLRMRSTYDAARRYRSATSTP